LPHAFTVRVRTIDPEKLREAREAWAKIPKVDLVAADFEWSERLARWVGFGQRLVAIAALVLAAAVTFIVGHLIRLQVVSRREEIEVSQLIGATAADVRRPFLYHGLVEAGLAGAVAVGLAAAAAAWLAAELRALTPAYAAELKVVFLDPSWVCAVVGGAALLGLLGAWWAVGRELRRFSPRR